MVALHLGNKHLDVRAVKQHLVPRQDVDDGCLSKALNEFSKSLPSIRGNTVESQRNPGYPS